MLLMGQHWFGVGIAIYIKKQNIATFQLFNIATIKQFKLFLA